MKKLKFLVTALMLCSLVSMSFAGDSMFFDAMSGAGHNPANWTEPSAWMDWNGSGNSFNRVPTADDYAFVMDGYYWGSDPTVDTAIVNSSAAVKGLWVGYWGCAGSMNIQEGANLAITNQSTIGINGNAAVSQSGGTFTSTAVRIGGAGNTTDISLSGGQMTANGGGFVVGDAGGGTVTMNQTGGTLTTNAFAMGKSSSDTTYNMTGGTINGVQYGGNFYIGAIATGTGSVKSQFNLGDAVSTGTIQMSKDASLAIDYRNSTLHGWGLFDLGGQGSSAARLWNSGKVIADGYGQKRDLDLSQFGSVQIYDDRYTNTTDNGWYAVNGGRLLLPGIAVTAGNGSYNWGEDAGFDETYMVNSIHFNFTGVSSGQLIVKLLADDRSDVAAHDGLTFLAVWQMDQLACANANIIFRFDDAKAAALGIAESSLVVYKLVDGAWVALPGTVDSVGNYISTTTDSLGTFAVGVPEPTTLILAGIGAALLRRKKSC